MHRLDELPTSDYGDKSEGINTATTEHGSTLQKYTEKDVELALQELALNGGNFSRTSAILETQHKLHVPAATLSKWAKTSFTNRYRNIQHTVRNTIAKDVSSKLTENAQRSAELTGDILESLADNVDELNPNELAKAAKDVSQIASNSIDKALLLRGQPTDISVQVTPEEMLAELKRLSVKLPELEEDTGESSS